MAVLSEHQIAMVEHLLATAADLPARFPLVSAGEFLRLLDEPNFQTSHAELRRESVLEDRMAKLRSIASRGSVAV